MTRTSSSSAIHRSVSHVVATLHQRRRPSAAVLGSELPRTDSVWWWVGRAQGAVRTLSLGKWPSLTGLAASLVVGISHALRHDGDVALTRGEAHLGTHARQPTATCPSARHDRW